MVKYKISINNENFYAINSLIIQGVVQLRVGIRAANTTYIYEIIEENIPTHT
jgi:hypothetical protein